MLKTDMPIFATKSSDLWRRWHLRHRMLLCSDTQRQYIESLALQKWSIIHTGECLECIHLYSREEAGGIYMFECKCHTRMGRANSEQYKSWVLAYLYTAICIQPLALCREARSGAFALFSFIIHFCATYV